MKVKLICILVMTLLIITVIPFKATNINFEYESRSQPPIQWENTYGWPEPGFSNFVQQTSDGGYISTGVIVKSGGTDSQVYLVKTDANGNGIWTQSYGVAITAAGSLGQQERTTNILPWSTIETPVRSIGLTSIPNRVPLVIRAALTLSGVGFWNSIAQTAPSCSR